MSTHECEKAIATIDLNNNRKLDFDEFWVWLMKPLTPWSAISTILDFLRLKIRLKALTLPLKDRMKVRFRSISVVVRNEKKALHFCWNFPSLTLAGKERTENEEHSFSSFKTNADDEITRTAELVSRYQSRRVPRKNVSSTTLRKSVGRSLPCAPWAIRSQQK